MPKVIATFDLQDFNESGHDTPEQIVDRYHSLKRMFESAFAIQEVKATMIDDYVEFEFNLDNEPRAEAIVEVIQWITTGDAVVKP